MHKTKQKHNKKNICKLFKEK